MVPPRLTLVSDNTRDMDEDSSPDDTTSGRGTTQPAASYADPEAAVDHLTAQSRREKLRRLEAVLFASSQPIDAKTLQSRCLEDSDDADAMLKELQKAYADRGVNLIKVSGKWLFRTAEDLSYLLEKQTSEERKLSKAGLETMAIIAYHQPVTRAEIEEIRGVSISPGTIDLLMETGWVRPRGRRRAPGRPITYGTTELFLTHFGLDSIRDLPGLADLKAAGLLDTNLPPGFTVPEPRDVAALMPDELPLEDGGEDDDQGSLALQVEDEIATSEAESEETDDKGKAG